MNTATLTRDALKPRGPDRIGPGLLLALIVHAGLVVAIAIGVNWRSHPPEAMSAELWSAVPQAAAPRLVEPEAKPVPPPPAPKPAPAPKPVPVPKVEPPPARELPDAQIAIEKARREKERQQQLDEQEAQRERDEQRKKDQAAAERQQQQQQQQELERQHKADEAKRKADEARQKAEEAKQEAKQKADEARREAERKKAEDALRAAARKDQERIMGMAGASGEAGATGKAKQSSGPSSSYGGRVVAKVRPNIVFTEDPASNPFAEFEVRAAPDGTIISTRLTKSSGIPSWDNAAQRAIIKTEILPRDTDGTVPSPITIALRPRN